MECRAHKRKQDVQWIDELDGKARSLGFSKVIAISGSGFTEPALAEAADRGIEALHLKAAGERLAQMDVRPKDIRCPNQV